MEVSTADDNNFMIPLNVGKKYKNGSNTEMVEFCSTGSRCSACLKLYSTAWNPYLILVTKYQMILISCWEECSEKNFPNHLPIQHSPCYNQILTMWNSAKNEMCKSLTKQKKIIFIILFPSCAEFSIHRSQINIITLHV